MARRTTTPVPKKLAEGTWTVRWRAKLGDKETRHRRTFSTQTAANNFIRNEWAPAHDDRDWRAAETPFRDYARAWLEVTRPTVKVRTAEGYGQSLKHSLAYFDSTPVGEINARRAREFIAHLQATPTLRTSRSIRTTYQMFRAVMTLAYEDDAIQRNPAEVAAKHLPKPSTHRNAEGHVVPTFSAKPPSQADIAKVVSALAQQKRQPYDLMVDLLANTGLRTGELAGLQVGDVRLWLSREVWRGTLAVRRTKRKVPESKMPGGWFTDTPKSKRSTRDVSLPSQIAEALHAYLATHPNNTNPDAPLFPNRKRGGYTHGERGSIKADSAAHGSLDWSEPIEPRAFYRNVYLPTLVGVGLPKSRLHDLRHAFARTYLANGGDIHRLSEQMGHGSYRITYDVYAEWIPSEDDTPNPLDQRRLRAN